MSTSSKNLETFRLARLSSHVIRPLLRTYVLLKSFLVMRRPCIGDAIILVHLIVFLSRLGPSWATESGETQSKYRVPHQLYCWKSRYFPSIPTGIIPFPLPCWCFTDFSNFNRLLSLPAWAPLLRLGISLVFFGISPGPSIFWSGNPEIHTLFLSLKSFGWREILPFAAIEGVCRTLFGSLLPTRPPEIR